MQHGTVAENGHEYKHARSRGDSERFQPHGKDLGRSCLLLKKSDWDEALVVGS